MANLFATTTDERRYALTILAMLTRSPEPPAAIYIVHSGVPIPKGRPRFSKHAYTPKRTVDAEQDLAWTLKFAIRERMVGPLALVALFYVPDQRRQDCDNLLKLLKDAGNQAGIWHDDSQVIACTARVDLDAANPRTVIAIAPAMSDLRRMPPKPKAKSRSACLFMNFDEPLDAAGLRIVRVIQQRVSDLPCECTDRTPDGARCRACGGRMYEGVED
jgi:Holliday junction resolvase RusA-like endonuclease